MFLKKKRTINSFNSCINWYLNYHDNFTLTLKNLKEPIDIKGLKLYKLNRSF